MLTDPYFLFKSLHIIAATLFVGSAASLILLRWMTVRTGDVHAVRFTQDASLKIDRGLTHPAMMLVLISGLMLAWYLGPGVYHSVWVMSGLCLFLIAIALRWIVIRPTQRKMTHVLREDEVPRFEELVRLERRWLAYQTLILALSLAIIPLMVGKFSS